MRREISQDTLEEWVSKKKYIKDRLLRIKKKLKKILKQEKHFEMRLRLVEEYEKRVRTANQKSSP